MASASFQPNRWTIFAEGDTRSIDEEEVRRALPILFAPGERHEIRAIADGPDGEIVRSRVVSADDPDAALAAIGGLDGTIHFILNPIHRDAWRANSKTVTHRRWMLVDIDPRRPADVSATEAEKAEATKLVDAILADLGSAGWPAPVIADSGNGWHMMYRIDLPNDRTVHGLIKNCLHALAKRHDTAAAHVDTIVHDAPRPCKLPGSWARKGPDTADRPHRRAKILYVPDPLEVVSADQVKALAGLIRDKKPVEPVAPAPAAPVDPWLVRASESSSLDNYVASAIQRECAAVSIAPVGERNARLNTAAFNLGTMADWPEARSHNVTDALTRAAAQAGLVGLEVEKTIRSGWEAGKASPRQRPEPGAAKAKADAQAQAQADAIKGKRPIKYAAEVKVRKIEFLWPGRIPLSKLTTFAGHGGLGKTFVLCDIAARISQGMEWPLAAGECATPGDVLFISGEDDESDTLVPRLMACGADLNRVAFLSDDFSDVFTLVNLSSLAKAVEALGVPRLIIIDPPTNYLEGVDDHKNSELRSRVLRPLATFASKYNVAIVLNNHVNKSSGKDVEAACRVMGSVAWVNGVRTAFLFVRDDQDPDKVVIATIKTNVGRYPKAITYKIVPLEDDADMARVEWLGEEDGSADQIGKKMSRGAQAVEWLIAMFRERREWLSDELFRAAKEHGVSRNALFSADVQALPIRKRRRVGANGDSFFVWTADDGWPLNIVRPPEDEPNPEPPPNRPSNTDAIDKLSKPF